MARRLIGIIKNYISGIEHILIRLGKNHKSLSVFFFYSRVGVISKNLAEDNVWSGEMTWMAQEEPRAWKSRDYYCGSNGFWRTLK